MLRACTAVPAANREDESEAYKTTEIPVEKDAPEKAVQDADADEEDMAYAAGCVFIFCLHMIATSKSFHKNFEERKGFAKLCCGVHMDSAIHTHSKIFCNDLIQMLPSRDEQDP